MAQLLDNLSIKWCRPGFLYWNNKENKYFPDFYLEDYDLYIDPKNPYKLEGDRTKLTDVVNNHKIKLLIIKSDKLINETLLDVFNDVTRNEFLVI